MKNFVFRPDRVLDWRRAQARLEEGKLEGLNHEVRVIEARQQSLLQERVASENETLAAQSTTGLQLAALDEFRRFTVAEHARLERQRAECGRRVAAQVQVLAAKRREIRLLERLRERRLHRWSTELERETAAQADEAFLLKWFSNIAGLQ